MRPSPLSSILAKISAIIALLLPGAGDSWCRAGAETGQDAGTPATLWQKELREALVSTNASPGFELELTGYKYRGQLESRKDVSAILREMFGEGAVFALNGEDGLKMVPFKEISVPAPKHIKDNSMNVKDLIEPGMRVIDLNWAYKGAEYHSVAVVSDSKGIIYDNIGTLAVIRRDKESYDDFSPGRCISTSSEEITDAFGRRALYYLARFDSVFGRGGILSDIKDVNDTYALEHSGWTCSVEAETTEGEIDVTRYRTVSTSISVERKPFLYEGRAFGMENSSQSRTQTHSGIMYKYNRNVPPKPKAKAKPASPGKKDWRAELQTAMDADGGSSELKLTGWSLRKGITEERELSELLAVILDGDSVTAINSGDSIRFTTFAELTVPDVEAVSQYVDYGLYAVDLTWEYRGKTYSSVALASDAAGILYDNIGTCVITDIKWREEEVNGTDDTYFGVLGTLFDGFHRKAAEMKFLQKASFDSRGHLSGQSNRWDNNGASTLQGCQVGFTGSVVNIGGKVHESDFLSFEWHSTVTSPNGFKPEEGSPFTAGGKVTLSPGK